MANNKLPDWNWKSVAYKFRISHTCCQSGESWDTRCPACKAYDEAQAAESEFLRIMSRGGKDYA